MGPLLNGSFDLYGSWLGTDATVGTVQTAWYRATPDFFIFVAGYPSNPRNQLFVEVRTPSSRVRVPIEQGEDPKETWQLRRVSIPPSLSPVSFRIVATDGSSQPSGWLGFSRPFVVTGLSYAELSKEGLLLFLATVAAITFIFLPGLLIRARYRLPFIVIPFPGFLFLAALGLLAWKGPHALSSTATARVGLWILALLMTYQIIRNPLSRVLSVTERKVLLVLLNMIVIAVAKATWSQGPPGELFAGRISRTLEVGGRSDSRISYYVVQLVATRNSAFGSIAKSLYETWTFSDRGPLSGFAASPIVMASPVQVLTTPSDQPWTLFDPEGFAAFRVAMIVLACGALAPVYGLALLWLEETWAHFAFLIVVTSPFVLHETFFTWPKLESAAFILLAAFLLVRLKPFLAGFAVGLGYLFHPSALLWSPALLGLITANSGVRPITRWLRNFVLLACGIAVWLVVWRLVNRAHFTQTNFVYFAIQAGGLPGTLHNWLWSRYDSLFNTLVPLHIFVFDRADESVNSIYGQSPLGVVFFVQYWSTLPFGAGIAFFPFLVRFLYAGWKRARPWLLWIFIVPLGIFTLYWGAARTGMMREGLHAWFLGLMIFAIVIWRKFLPSSTRLWHMVSWSLLFRGVEALGMLLVPTLLSKLVVVPQFALSDTLSVILVVAVTSCLYFYVFRVSEQMRSQQATDLSGTLQAGFNSSVKGVPKPL